MLSATLREIDSAVRWERVLTFWQRYMRLIIGTLIVITLSGAAFFYHHVRTTHSLEEASAQYTEALQLFRREKAEDAEHILRTLAKSAPAPYNFLAQFRLAGAIALKDASSAASMFDELAKNAGLDVTLQDAARMRSIFLRFETFQDLQAFEKELSSLLSPSNFWHSNAQELAGLLAWRLGNLDSAKMYFESIRSTPQAPISLQKRANEFLELIAHSSQNQKHETASSVQNNTSSEHLSPQTKKKGP